jgi:predicted P-loop ATPase
MDNCTVESVPITTPSSRRSKTNRSAITTSIDIQALSADRDQLFAEAVHLFKAGAKWWPEKDFEVKHIKPQQETRYESDAWEEPIAEYLENKNRVSVCGVAKAALYMETARIGTAEQRRIGSILTTLKWKPVKDWKGRAYVQMRLNAKCLKN